MEAYRSADGTFERIEQFGEASDTDDLPAGEVVIVLVSSFVGAPWWQQLVAEELGIADFAVPSLPSRGAMVFCACHDPAQEGVTRWVVWTFGIGSRYLSRTALEPRFGVISALNRIIGDGSAQALLRKLQYSQQGAYRQKTGHMAFDDTPLAGFRMDQVRDLLAAVGGKPPDADAQIFGGRNLTFRTDVDTLGVLAEHASIVMTDYRSDSYKQDSGFIDDYVPVEDPKLREDMDAVLSRALRNSSDQVDLALPLDLEDFSDERSVERVLLPGERLTGPVRTVLTIDVVTAAMARGEVELDSQLRFADYNNTVIGRATLRDCLSADLSVGGERFFLADGTYYQVREEFIDAVDAELEAIQAWETHLPRYGGGCERGWTERAAELDGFVLLDGWLIELPGRTSVEAADLVHSSGALIHAKRKGRSSSLSYLFVQASASSQLLSESPEAVEQFRTKVQEVAPEPVKVPLLAALRTLDQSRPGLEVVLAILGDWHNKGPRNLPLVAKLELRAAVRAIQQRGFYPCLALVNLVSRP